MELITPKIWNIQQVKRSVFSYFCAQKDSPIPCGITLSSTIDAM